MEKREIKSVACFDRPILEFLVSFPLLHLPPLLFSLPLLLLFLFLPFWLEEKSFEWVEVEKKRRIEKEGQKLKWQLQRACERWEFEEEEGVGRKKKKRKKRKRKNLNG